MGKRARKTRWRTLAIGDDHSDSEESTSTLDTGRIPAYGGYHHNKYYSNRFGGSFTHSSQSTPTRRYQQQGGSDGTKSTRSSSTTSENKITFNEDEYTRITTPRQDVLFKKGYLNKPKNYQTQISSTGTSTTSTSNSTGNGTPDYQSTDLEYESHYLFPNGFLDQNGIYYVNGFDPYSFMVYNPPPPYYEDGGTKGYSTESLTESGTTNEESVQESVTAAPVQNGGENQNKEDHNGYHDPSNGLKEGATDEGTPADQKIGRIKKRRRRKDSDGASENSQDEFSAEGKENGVDPAGGTPRESDGGVKEEEVVPNGVSSAQNPDSTAETTPPSEKKSSLKPDAQEFVPRALQEVQYVIPVPLINGFNPAFLPPQAGYPINYLPQPQVYPGFVGYPYPPKYDEPPPESVENEDPIVEPVPKEEPVRVNKIEERKRAPFNNRFKQNGFRQPKRFQRKADGFKEAREEFPRLEIKTREEFPKPAEPAQDKTEENQPQTVKKTEPETIPSRQEQTNLSGVPAKNEKIPSHTNKPHWKPDSKFKPATSPQKRVKKYEIKTQEDKVIINPDKTKQPKRWIPVSKKKRRNKNLEELNDSFPEDEKDEEYETYFSLSDVVTDKDVKEVVIDAPKIEVIETKPSPVQKKKPKKPIQRRVIITDIDLSIHPEDEPNEVKCDINDNKKEEVKPEPKDEIEAQKKNKKKKKKIVKSISASSSMSQLNATEDSYDTLLDFTEESNNKTNVEISQELDLIIQRGMYNSLEGKIRELNITPLSDDFFQAVIKPENGLSTNKWNRFLGNTLTNIKVPEASAEHLKNEQGGSSIDEVPEVYVTTCSIEITPEKKEYPITEAVKNWLNKTRENTPDVEVLKSPGTIRRQFSNRAGSEVKVIVRDERSPESEEEITLYTADAPYLNGDGDLLDCWEDEMIDGVSKRSDRKANSIETDPGNSTDSKTVTDQSDPEEELQVYESKYGQNEDYLRLKEEIDEKKRQESEARARNFPKHGALPYRAICCNVM